MAKTSFLKMHGTGNDFVVLDGRTQVISLSKEQAVRLAHRHFGIGCDTIVVLEKSSSADVSVRFLNSDGSASATCGNASRCVASLIMDETGKDAALLETGGGVLKTTRAADGRITVNMGAPKFGWQEIPLSESRNTAHLGLQEGLLMDPVAVNMGNPHAVFFVHDLHHIKMAEWGATLEHHPLFPERANISAVQVIDQSHVKMLVWERGAGLTMACGSGACAAAVAAHLRGLTGRKVEVELPGGSLEIEWLPGENGDVLMSGAVAKVFEGNVEI